MVTIVDRVRLRVRFIFQRQLEVLLDRLKNLFGALTSEDGTTQSARIFYFVSLMLLISLVLLSPDKILQILAPTQLDSEIVGKTQDIMKLFRRIIPI